MKVKLIHLIFLYPSLYLSLYLSTCPHNALESDSGIFFLICAVLWYTLYISVVQRNLHNKQLRRHLPNHFREFPCTWSWSVLWKTADERLAVAESLSSLKKIKHNYFTRSSIILAFLSPYPTESLVIECHLMLHNWRTLLLFNRSSIIDLFSWLILDCIYFVTIFNQLKLFC